MRTGQGTFGDSGGAATAAPGAHRPVMAWTRRRIAALLAALGLGAALKGQEGTVRAAARVTRGPYLQNATPTGATLLWRLDAPATGAVELRPLGPARSPAGPAAPAAAPAATPGEWQTFGAVGTLGSHAVTLSGLDPDTRYEYRVRAGGETVFQGGRFRTLPPLEADSLQFVFMADNQTGHAPHAEIVRRIMAEPTPPQLVLHGGDQCENGSRPEQWDQWFQIEQELISQVPLFPCLGNHEENSPLYFEHFRVPGNGTATGRGRWYSFDAGPAHFVALDVVYSDVQPGSPQFRWLDADLERTDRRFKFIYFHYPPYNASPHHGSNLRLRYALEPLFIRHKVTAVFNGHGHLYERAFGDQGDTEAAPLPWFVAGGGGGVPQPIGRAPFTQYTEVTYHFLRVTIQGDRLTTVGVRPDGSTFDEFRAVLAPDGRLRTDTPAQSVQVPQETLAQWATTPRAGVVAGYAAAGGAALPLGFSLVVPSRRRQVVPVPSGALSTGVVLPEDPHTDWRGLPVIRLAAVVAGLVLLAVLPAAPLRWLIGFDPYTLLLSAHGGIATALLLLAAAGATLGYRLATHRGPSLPGLRFVALATAVLAAISAVLGDALYAAYLKTGGPLDSLVSKAPDAHVLLMEYKARLGLLPLPLSVAAAFIAWRYRTDLRRDRHLAELVALMLVLVVLSVLGPYTLGAAITRLRGIL